MAQPVLLNPLLCCRQVDRTLAAEQKRADFLPRADGGPALELERPTEAALLATALLRAAARVATANLHGANLSSFLTQVPSCMPVGLLPSGQQLALDLWLLSVPCLICFDWKAASSGQTPLRCITARSCPGAAGKAGAQRADGAHAAVHLQRDWGAALETGRDRVC